MREREVAEGWPGRREDGKTGKGRRRKRRKRAQVSFVETRIKGRVLAWRPALRPFPSLNSPLFNPHSNFPSRYRLHPSGTLPPPGGGRPLDSPLPSPYTRIHIYIRIYRVTAPQPILQISITHLQSLDSKKRKKTKGKKLRKRHLQSANIQINYKEKNTHDGESNLTICNSLISFKNSNWPFLKAFRFNCFLLK